MCILYTDASNLINNNCYHLIEIIIYCVFSCLSCIYLAKPQNVYYCPKTVVLAGYYVHQKQQIKEKTVKMKTKFPSTISKS